MKRFGKTIIGLICLLLMVGLTYIAYKLPVIIGFDKPSKILGIIGFIISLRISVRLASYT